MRLAGMLSKAPVALKGRLLEALARRVGLDPNAYVVSNLGISNGLRFKVPAKRQDLAFGRPDDSLSERATLALAKLLAPSCDHFVDVGANFGLFSASVRMATGGRVPMTAVEADPTLAALLDDNLRTNFGEGACEVVRAAASAAAGRTAFNRNLDDDLSGSLTDHFSAKHRLESVEVDGVTIADLLRRKQTTRALVKVDVEGAGTLAWTGASPEWRRIRFLLMEIIGPETEARLPDVICRDTGWAAYYIRDFRLIESRMQSWTYVDPFWNWLFTSVPAHELRRLLGDRFEVVAGTGG